MAELLRNFDMSKLLDQDGPITYILLIAGITLSIASLCVPYYIVPTAPSTTTGTDYGIWSNNQCLGFSDDDCNTIKALPIITIILGFFALMMKSGKNSILQSILEPVKSLFTMIPFYDKLNIFAGMTITFGILVLLTAIFSSAALGTQLALPVTLGGAKLSLMEQSEKSCNLNPVVFDNGMALSAASTAAFVGLLLIHGNDLSKFLMA